MITPPSIHTGPPIADAARRGRSRMPCRHAIALAPRQNGYDSAKTEASKIAHQPNARRHTRECPRHTSTASPRIRLSDPIPQPQSP